jgi:NTP pyrophosphatase (non-canonical NTP hydrolase)
MNPIIKSIALSITHPELVRALCKPGQQIADELTAEGAHLWHMSSCLCGEAGELFDAIKRKVIYQKKLDRANVVEELGDLEFYLEGLRAALGITREETLEGNIAKLSTRYGELKYSDTQAQERADKTIASFVEQGLVKIEEDVEHVHVVHHLHEGVTACRMFGDAVPKDWPAGHLWSGTWEETDCSACLAARK